MGYQDSPLNSGARREGSSYPGKSLTELGVDALKLLDLQLQLAQLDLKEFWTRSRVAIAILGVSLAVMVAALPVGLFGISEYVRNLFNLSIEFSLVLVSGICVLLSLAGVFWSIRHLGAAAHPLKRTRDELYANLSWMRNLLHKNEDNA